jgi:hypothetical protein
MPGISYLHEKFMGAVTILALSVKSRQDRLIQVIGEEQLILFGPKDFPKHLQKVFEKFDKAVTNNHQGKIDEVVGRMSDEQAERNIHLVLELSYGLAEEYYGESGG